MLNPPTKKYGLKQKELKIQESLSKKDEPLTRKTKANRSAEKECEDFLRPRKDPCTGEISIESSPDRSPQKYDKKGKIITRSIIGDHK